MQLIESSAILLQVTNLQERDRIVSFLTPDYGRKRGVANGARTKFSRFQGVLQPLAEVEISWSEKAGRDLVRIGDVSLVGGVAHHQETLEQILIAQYFAESMERFTVENQSAVLEVRLLSSCVHALRSSVPIDPLMRYFEVWLLQLAGIFSLVGECPGCGKKLEEGAVLPQDADALFCQECCVGGAVGGKVYGAEVLAFVRACADVRPLELKTYDPRMLRQVEGLTREVRRRFLGAALRSYKVMKRTLAEVG